MQIRIAFVGVFVKPGKRVSKIKQEHLNVWTLPHAGVCGSGGFLPRPPRLQARDKLRRTILSLTWSVCCGLLQAILIVQRR